MFLQIRVEPTRGLRATDGRAAAGAVARDRGRTRRSAEGCARGEGRPASRCCSRRPRSSSSSWAARRTAASAGRLVPARDRDGRPQRRLRPGGAGGGVRRASLEDAISQPLLGMNAFAKAILGYALTIVSVRVVFGGALAVGAALAVASLANEAIVALLVGAAGPVADRHPLARRPLARGGDGCRRRSARGGVELPVARVVEAAAAAEAAVTEPRRPRRSSRRMLRIREDRQALVRRDRDLARGGGRRAVAAGGRVLVRPDRPRRLLLLALREQPHPRGQDHRAARLRPRPQRRDPRRERAGVHPAPLPPRGPGPRGLDRLHRGAAGALDAKQVRLPRRARPAGARVRPDPDRREPRHRGGGGGRGARDRAPGVRHHGLAAPPLQARRLGRPRPRVSRPRPRPSRSRRPPSVYQVGDWIGQKGIESAYQRLLAGANGERRVIVDSHGREVAGGQPARGHARAEPLPDARPQAPGRRRGVLPRPRRHGRRHGSADRRDPRARVLAVLRPQLVHAPRDLGGVDGPPREPGPAAPEPGDPEHVLARVGLQGVPGLRRARAGPRGSRARRSSVPGHADVLRPRVPLPQEGRPRLGQPARRDQDVVRRLLLQPRPAASGSTASARSRRRSDSGSRPASTCRSRSRASCRPRSGRESGAARAGTRARRSRSRSARGRCS